MKTLIVATSEKPANWESELQLGQRYRIEYLDLSERLSTSYVDYDPPWIHDNRTIRKLEEMLRIDFYWARRVASIVDKQGYEAVVSMSERVAVPLGYTLSSRIKHVALLLNAFSKKWFPMLKILKTYQRWDRTVFYSNAEAEALQNALKLEGGKTAVIHNYVDTEFFKSADQIHSDQNGSFVFSQGLTKRDYPTLIQAMRQLPDIDCYISAKSAWDNFKTGFEGLQLPENVHIKSYDHPSLIREAISKCRFVVIPMHPDIGQWCTGSTSVLQAQAMGKPIIVTYLPGIREYVLDTETGFLVEGYDATALAESIDYLWKNPEIAKAMGQCGQQWVQDNFSLEVWLNKMTSLLDDLAYN